MTTAPTESGDERERAAGRLGVPADAGPAEVRAALLRRLQKCDFVPPAELLCAYGAFVPGVLPGQGSEAKDDEWAAEPHLRDQVEELAAAFFGLPVAQRRQRWRELVELCASYPPLAARLRELGPGLAVDPAEVPEDETPLKELAGHVCELFTRRPAARARKRQELLKDMTRDRARWGAAALSLQRQHSALAALAPELISRLRSWSGGREKPAKIYKEQQPSGVAVQETYSGKYYWFFLLIANLVFCLIRLELLGFKPILPPRPTVDFRLPPAELPKADPQPLQDRLWKELEKVRQHHPDNGARGRVPPSRKDKAGPNRQLPTVVPVPQKGPRQP